ncbi:MAG TPA: SMC-Scp complex subunit ScpB [Planctomycetota bacterium]|nr:SMC-Scp complex subunit ScpB [Planctomycetota bacterium]
MAAKKSAPKKEKPADKKKKARVKDEPEVIVADAPAAIHASEVKSKKRGKSGAAKAAAPVAEVVVEKPAEEPKKKRKGRNKAEPIEAEAIAVIAPEVTPEAAESSASTTEPAPAADERPRRKGKKKTSEESPSEAGENGSSAQEKTVEAPVDAAAQETPAEAGEADEEKADVNPDELIRTIEALLFAAEEPIAVREIARAAGSDSATVRKLLPGMIETYEKERRPWTISEVAGGYRFMTRPEFFPAIQRLKTQTAQRKLTQAALETLALIAYRQPIGRAEIESVRGVGAGPVIRILLEKKLIKISGRGTGIGQPLLYGTTDYFLEHFGLKSIADLPKPGEFKGA